MKVKAKTSTQVQTKKTIEVAVGVLVRDSQDGPLVLITRRPNKGVLAGYWEFPGGKVDGEESVAQCLEREFKEEVGLDIKAGELIEVVEHEYDHGHLRLHFHYCDYQGGPVWHYAVVDHVWAEPRRLNEFSFPPANQSILNQVVKKFSKPQPRILKQSVEMLRPKNT